MKFEYTLKEQDFLDFQLFTAQQRPRFYPRQKNGRWFLSLIAAIVAIYFGYKNEWGLVTYLGLLTLVLFLFYPRYFRWRQKIHYIRFIRQHYRNSFDSTEGFERSGSTVKLANNTGEGEIKRTEFTEIVETGNHFFLYLKSGSGLIIPKNQVDEAEVRKELKALNLPFSEILNWQW